MTIDQYIQQHGRRLFGLCMTLCADRFSAEDLYQETWLRVCRRIGQYDPRREFEPWLTGICVNAYRDELRKRKLSRLFDGFATTEEKEQTINSVEASQPEDHSDLHSAIERLPEKLRTAVILHYFHDMKHEQTAAALGIPVGTVKSRLNQAKKLLREELQYEADI